MSGQLDLLVPPLGGAVPASDQATAVNPPEIPVNEPVEGLGLLTRPVGEGQVPGAVLVPGVVLEERVLVVGGGLIVTPIGVEDVLASPRSARAPA